mgnify:CR=1 FL=1
MEYFSERVLTDELADAKNLLARALSILDRNDEAEAAALADGLVVFPQAVGAEGGGAHQAQALGAGARPGCRLRGDIGGYRHERHHIGGPSRKQSITIACSGAISCARGNIVTIYCTKRR